MPLRPPVPLDIYQGYYIIIDIDGTCIDSVLLPYPQGAYKASLREIEFMTHHDGRFVLTEDDNGGSPVKKYEVYYRHRPGVRDFLRRMASLGEIIFWTAATARYAAEVLTTLVPVGVTLYAVLDRRHCKPQKGGYFCKDLNSFWERGYCKQHVLMIDNEPSLCLHSCGNLFSVKTWYAEASQDNTLMALAEELTDVLTLMSR